jgi:glycosyltransferase involved in cell wall biosynthesis
MYNSEETINKCIDSIKNQTFKNLEVILIDDGSKDNTLNESIRLTKNDDRFLIISQNNSGASAARNAGIIKSSGDYIMFVDSDDYIDVDMVETLILSALKENADYVVCGLVTEMNKGTSVTKTKHSLVPRFIQNNTEIPDNILDLVENEKINGPYCKLIRSQVVKDNKIFMPENIALQEDLYFNLKVMSYTKNILVLEETPYHYILGNDKSVTMRYYPNKYEMLNEVHNLLINFYEDRSNNDEIIRRIKFIYLKNVYASFLNLFHKDCNLNKKQKLLYISDIVNSSKFQTMMKQAKRNGLKYFILKQILITKNKRFIYTMSKCIHFIRNRTKYGYY